MITTRHIAFIRPDFSLLLMLLAILGGCATTPNQAGSSANLKTAAQIYAEGRSALQAENYDQAGKSFKSLEVYYPDSPYNHQAQMELAYAYFKSADYTSAIATSDRIIRNFPDNANLDYARYLKALSSFEQATALIEKEGDTENAILTARTSLQYFNDLATHNPNSKYQQDADKRVAYLKEQLAQYEVAAARRDIEQGNHASAVIHARNVIENYPQTHSAADALAIADMGYEMMSIGSASKTSGANTDTDDSTTADTMTANSTGAGMTDAALPTATTATGTDTATTVTADQSPDDGMTADATATADEESSISDGETEMSTGRETITADTNMAGQPAGARPTSWILEQPADHYTIQLISTRKDDTLPAFIDKNRLNGETAYFRKRVNGQTWHALIYGVYPDTAAARAAIEELPDGARRGKPWVLGIATVQKTINDFNNTP